MFLDFSGKGKVAFQVADHTTLNLSEAGPLVSFVVPAFICANLLHPEGFYR